MINRWERPLVARVWGHAKDGRGRTGAIRGLGGKRVVVTGGSHEIGAAACRRLAEEGAKVGVMNRTGFAGG